jgi:hypothetical protein
MPDGSSIQRHSAGPHYPFIVGMQEHRDGRWFVMDPSGEIVGRLPIYGDACEFALALARAAAIQAESAARGAMSISFTAHGLDFDAEVDYTPGTPDHVSGPPDSWCEGDPDELEVVALSVDGYDALFLEDSSMWPSIYDAALKAAREQLESNPDSGAYEDTEW